MSERKFKVGDRVIAYGGAGASGAFNISGLKGVVETGSLCPVVKVKVDEGARYLNFHSKQLRKLKPKKRLEMWINTYSDGSRFTYSTKQEAEESLDRTVSARTVHFKEVIKK